MLKILLDPVVIVSCIVCLLLIVIFMVWFICTKIKKKKFINEMMEKLPDVEYTAIVSSSNGYGVAGNTNYNGGIAKPTIKFLVVYKSGEKQIVTLRDGEPLFNEYTLLLRVEK